MSIVGNAILLGGGETLPDAGGVSFGGTYAFIKAAYPEGSTCTCTNGSTTLTAEDTSGNYTFAIEVPSSGTDTWTVSCTNGNDIANKAVSIVNAEIITISIDYIHQIIFSISNYRGMTGIELIAEDGMTWEEWISSDYNTTVLGVNESMYI